MKKKKYWIAPTIFGVSLSVCAFGLLGSFIGGKIQENNYVSSAKEVINNIQDPIEVEAFKKEARMWIYDNNQWLWGAVAFGATSVLIVIALVVYLKKFFKEKNYYDSEFYLSKETKPSYSEDPTFDNFKIYNRF